MTYFAHFSYVSHARMTQDHEKEVCYMCVISLHLVFFLIMFLPSLLFLYIHFVIIFQSTVLPYFPVLKAQDMRHSTLASRSWTTWSGQMQTHISPNTNKRFYISCRQHFFRASHFLMQSCCADLFLLINRVYSHKLTSCTCTAQATEHIICVSPKNIHTSSSSRTVVHHVEPDITHGHSFLFFS